MYLWYNNAGPSKGLTEQFTDPKFQARASGELTLHWKIREKQVMLSDHSAVLANNDCLHQILNQTSKSFFKNKKHPQINSRHPGHTFVRFISCIWTPWSLHFIGSFGFLTELEEELMSGATVISKGHSKSGFTLLCVCPHAVYYVVAKQRASQGLSYDVEGTVSA